MNVLHIVSNLASLPRSHINFGKGRNGRREHDSKFGVVSCVPYVKNIVSLSCSSHTLFVFPFSLSGLLAEPGPDLQLQRIHRALCVWQSCQNIYVYHQALNDHLPVLCSSKICRLHPAESWCMGKQHCGSFMKDLHGASAGSCCSTLCLTIT